MCEKTPEMVVFSHNDIHGANLLQRSQIVNGRKVYTGIKVIDFEYANYNFRGIDLTKIIEQSTRKLNASIDERFIRFFNPSFETHEEGTMDIDLMVRTYLENFYDKHLERVIPDWD